MSIWENVLKHIKPGRLLFVYHHMYGYFIISGQSYCIQAHGCCSTSIASQQLKDLVFLLYNMTNTFVAAAKVRVIPGDHLMG